MNTMVMRGAWITPEGNVFYTDNAKSHDAVIREMGIGEKLKKESKKLAWNLKERKLHLDSNVPYISLRLGYIRIVVFGSQFSIESYAYPNQAALEMIEDVCEHFKFTMGYEFRNFSIELVKDGCFFSSDTLAGAMKLL